MWVFFWALYSMPLIYMPVFFFVPVPYCFNYHSFVVCSETRDYDFFSSISLCQGGFGYPVSFVLPYHFLFYDLVIFYSVYPPHLLYPFIWFLDCFHILAIENNATVNIRVHTSFWIVPRHTWKIDYGQKDKK